MTLSFDSEGSSFEGKLTLNGKEIQFCVLGRTNVQNLTEEEYTNTVGGLIAQAMFEPIFRAVQAWAKVSEDGKDGMWAELDEGQKIEVRETLNLK